MNVTIQPRMRQQVAMTPEFQRSIWMLQLSGVEFEQAVEEALVSNPFLERDEDEEAADAAATPSTQQEQAEASAEQAERNEGDAERDDEAAEPMWSASESSGSGSRDGDDDTDPGGYTAAPGVLRDHLLMQVGVSRLEGRDRELAALLVNSLDSDGYLRQSFDDIRGLLEPACSDDELNFALRWVQSLDPRGVGARSVVECLQLQLAQAQAPAPAIALAQRMLTQELSATSSHDLARLKRVFECDDEALREAYCLIRRCDPRPGSGFGADDTRYVVADVVVRKKGKRWVASINPQVMPRLQLNDAYAEILQRQRGSSTTPMGQQLQEARWFVRNVQQRFQTIQRVAQAIVDRQSRYFEYGEVAMRPLVLRDIAEELGLHESTVSRVTSNKYMATSRGLLELKRFFSSHIESQGNACSSTAVRALIRSIIDDESQEQPLSDIKVTKILERKGVHIARRTVSKYRDAMQIPPVEARRMAMRA